MKTNNLKINEMENLVNNLISEREKVKSNEIQNQTTEIENVTNSEINEKTPSNTKIGVKLGDKNMYERLTKQVDLTNTQIPILDIKLIKYYKAHHILSNTYKQLKPTLIYKNILKQSINTKVFIQILSDIIKNQTKNRFLSIFSFNRPARLNVRSHTRKRTTSPNKEGRLTKLSLFEKINDLIINNHKFNFIDGLIQLATIKSPRKQKKNALKKDSVKETFIKIENTEKAKNLLTNFTQNLASDNKDKDEVINKEIEGQKMSFKMRLELKKLNKGKGGSPQPMMKKQMSGLVDEDILQFSLVNQ